MAHLTDLTSATPIIPGVVIHALTPHADDRGCFTEIFRESWQPSPPFIQWNAVTSRAGTLRGVHVHRHHADYLVLVTGRMWLGLVDLRASGARATVLMPLGQPTPVAVFIPPMVAHGFLFADDSVHVYAVTHYFDGDDEWGCRWDDADLALPWPITPTAVSPRDQRLPSLNDLLATLGRLPTP